MSDTPTISFTVPGPPCAQPRQRQMSGATKAGKKYTSNYTPAKHPVNAYKAAVQLSCAAVSSSLLEGPLTLCALFVMPRPGKLLKTKPNPSYPHTGRPDLDNLEKALCDALSGVAFHDDAQVAQKFTRKIVAAAGEMPRTEVTLGPVETLTPCDTNGDTT